MSDEWPKRWTEIFGNEVVSEKLWNGESYLRLTDTLRSYQGTLYIREDAGREESPNNDGKWMPFEVYLNYQIDEVAEELRRELIYDG